VASIKVPAISEPTTEPESLRQAALQLKEGVEILSGQRGTKLNAAVTWQDLVNLGLILPSQVPPK
jgi:hypothetical protein